MAYGRGMVDINASEDVKAFSFHDMDCHSGIPRLLDDLKKMAC